MREFVTFLFPLCLLLVFCVRPYKKYPLVYRLVGVVILNGEFAAVSAEYNQKFGDKPSSPEQSAMLRHAMAVADRAIDAYARPVALTTDSAQAEAREKMQTQLTALYKNFHNNSADGLDQLLTMGWSKPVP
ncbi:MAG: hypothetical protein ABR555_08010 [Pyrinomonadaceae bacterium]